MHIRRGDFQYKDTRLDCATIWDNTKHLFNRNISMIIYIATDEKNLTFFDPILRSGFIIKFLYNYEISAKLTENHLMNMNHVGMIEQVICANAHTFVGTPYSTFTAYITRLRGIMIIITTIDGYYLLLLTIIIIIIFIK